MMKSAPEYPFQNGGTFTVHGKGFMFSSGTLAGSGKFVFATDSIFNLTDSASKAINTVLDIKGKLVTYTDRSTNLVLTGATVTVSGTFTSNAPLTISTDMNSKFHVTGSFAYTGSTLLLQGPGFLMDAWTVGPSCSVTVSNTFTSGTLDLGTGASLTLIGAPTETRTFTTITGAGTILNQGGVNTFNNVAGAALRAAGGTAIVASGKFTSLTLSGAFLGGTKLSTSSAELTSGFINLGLQLSVSSLILQGTIEIDDDNTALMVSTSVTIPINSLITMTAGSTISIANTATVTQNANLQIVPGAPKAKKPAMTIGGTWTSAGQFSVSEIPIAGTASYTIAATGSFNFNNVVFSAQAIMSLGTITTQIGTFNVGSITGAGTFIASPLNMNVNMFAGNAFTLMSGTVSIANLTMTTLDMKNGVLGVAAVAKVNRFPFEGGQLKGTLGSQAVMTVIDTALQGVTTQTLTNVALTTATFAMNCGAQACQFFSQNAAVRTLSHK